LPEHAVSPLAHTIGIPIAVKRVFASHKASIYFKAKRTPPNTFWGTQLPLKVQLQNEQLGLGFIAVYFKNLCCH